MHQKKKSEKIEYVIFNIHQRDIIKKMIEHMSGIPFRPPLLEQRGSIVSEAANERGNYMLSVTMRLHVCLLVTKNANNMIRAMRKI